LKREETLSLLESQRERERAVIGQRVLYTQFQDPGYPRTLDIGKIHKHEKIKITNTDKRESETNSIQSGHEKTGSLTQRHVQTTKWQTKLDINSKFPNTKMERGTP